LPGSEAAADGDETVKMVSVTIAASTDVPVLNFMLFLIDFAVELEVT
jgi:hypothetical protein